VRQFAAVRGNWAVRIGRRRIHRGSELQRIGRRKLGFSGRVDGRERNVIAAHVRNPSQFGRSAVDGVDLHGRDGGSRVGSDHGLAVDAGRRGRRIGDSRG
jgi:hypothetical protein